MGNWRVGRKVGRTIYDGDTLIGVMDTPELAARVVEAVNRRTASPVAPEGAAPTPPSEPCPNCESTTGCDCSPDDVLGAVVEQHPIPSSRTPGMSIASATTEGPRGETKP